MKVNKRGSPHELRGSFYLLLCTFHNGSSRRVDSEPQGVLKNDPQSVHPYLTGTLIGMDGSEVKDGSLQSDYVTLGPGSTFFCPQMVCRVTITFVKPHWVPGLYISAKIVRPIRFPNIQ